MKDNPKRMKSDKYCHFHRDRGNNIEECHHLEMKLKSLSREDTWDRSTLDLFPSSRLKHSNGYSRKSCEVGEFQTHHIKVFKLKYQECRRYYEEHVEENQGFFPNDSSTEYVQKDFGSPNHASEDDGNKSPPSSPRSVSSHPFTTNVAPVMMTNATTIEEQLASLTRAIEGLTKHVQEQDAQIARLIHKADNVDASHIMGKQVETHDEAELEDAMGYQPPKFQQFDGKGNPKQHVAHFVETCNNAGTYGDHLVKQFVRSLKGNAFDWYTDLEAGSIDGWEQLEQEFLNRFYSTRRTVSMVETYKFSPMERRTSH
ncbi:UNVERIFIED_CONTAM: hypothetical protein Slati_0504900 [Sesamum latifolium]|uniref:Retrotransposon gag domain-containing protein n=1 Tax=Sesamum latifolium TaxID=2727402 RepID=A0AAW2XZZ8_9LAMI